MHLKRQKTPKRWPINRKGTTYLVVPSFSIKNGIPVLVILRDILKVAQNKKEVKAAINTKNILINGKPVTSEKQNVLIFDVMSVPLLKKHYRISIAENGKFKIEDIDNAESEKKVSKVIGKKILRGKKMQINLSDGKNFITDIECEVNDSVIISLKGKKLMKCLPLKEKANAFVFDGKHAGKTGVINKINSKEKTAEISGKDGKVNVLVKHFMVVE